MKICNSSARLMLFSIAALLLSASPQISQAQDDGPTIENSDFASFTGGKPDGWTFRSNKQEFAQATDIDHETVDTALQITLVKDGGNSYGEILQRLKLKPATRYRISADIRSSPNGLGIIQVKTIRSKKELERLNSDRSKTDWETVSLEFDTANSDQVQVLCRYTQKGSQVGGQIWWTNLQIEELGDGAPPRDPESLEIAEAGIDQYVTPSGAGKKDGSDWANARAGGSDLQSALDAVGPGNTLHLGSGDYRDVSLSIERGGASSGEMVKIVGVDTGDGPPRFTSSFDKDNPGKGGGVLFRLAGYVGFVSIENVQAEAYAAGIEMDGPNRGIRISNVDVSASREGIIINGGAVANDLDSGSNDIVIRDGDFMHYTKRAIRLRGGVHDVQILNCHADAGGEAWATERFAMGFTVEGSKADGVMDHDITYENCTARNHYDNQGTKYWNGDGFSAERSVKNLTYRNCGAFDNTDGGWDIKAESPTFINCVSLGNKRNFRIWSKHESPARLENCVIAFSHHPGGTGNANGIHLANNAGVIVERCTFVENGQSIDLDGKGEPTWAKVSDSLIYEPNGLAKATEGGDTKVEVSGGVVIDENNAGQDPQFPNANIDWEGGDNSFDSATYPSAGYRSEPR